MPIRSKKINKKLIDKTLVLSTAFYIFKNKFDIQTYIGWMKNFLLYVENFKLIIYTNKNTYNIFKDIIDGNKNIKIIIKEIEDFYLYKYKNFFVENHKKNFLLRDKIDWKLNLLWCEKCYFVSNTIKEKYFEIADYYGWCDIGYFRNKTSKNWPKIKLLEDKIYYHSVSDFKNIKKINGAVDPNQNSICGGFFIGNLKKILWWKDIFENKLKYYIDKDYLVKDDQTIIVDCLLDSSENFKISMNNDWFYFIKYFL